MVSPAEKALRSMTPEDLVKAARSGNKLAQKILAKMQKEEQKRARKARRKAGSQ